MEGWVQARDALGVIPNIEARRIWPPQKYGGQMEASSGQELRWVQSASLSTNTPDFGPPTPLRIGQWSWIQSGTNRAEEC